MFKNDILDSILNVTVDYVSEYLEDKFRKKVVPKAGSVVYCELVFDYAEHSGIYIGDNQIVHLNGKGKIEIVTPTEFLKKTTGHKIFVSSRNGEAVGSRIVAERAKSQVGKYRNYNVILDNCHQFSSGCLTGNFESSNNYLFMLKNVSKQVLSANEWRVWRL